MVRKTTSYLKRPMRCCTGCAVIRGGLSLANVQEELAKLELIRRLDLPGNLFDDAPPHDLDRYRRRVTVEAPYELRRHTEPARLDLAGGFCVSA